MPTRSDEKRLCHLSKFRQEASHGYRTRTATRPDCGGQGRNAHEEEPLRIAYGFAKGLFIAAALSVMLSPAATRQLSEKEKDAATEMPAPKPSRDMDKLRFLTGTWDVTGEYAKSEIVPQDRKSTGWYRAQLGPGGFSIIAEFEADGPVGKEKGHEVLAWDPKHGIYTVVTVGNAFPGALIGHGHWEGENLITEVEFELGGAKVQNRTVYSKLQDNAIHIEGPFRTAGGPYQPL